MDALCIFGHRFDDEDGFVERLVGDTPSIICIKHERKILNGEVPNKVPMRDCEIESHQVPVTRCAFCTFGGCRYNGDHK